MRSFIFLFLIPFIIHAQVQKTPQQIQKELNDAEAQYNQAKKMFNPWYTGPLVTPAASMMPVGMGNVQPYLFFGGTYAAFNQERRSVSLPHNVYSLQVTPLLFFGVTDTVDFQITPGAIVNWQDHQTGGGFNDLTATVGFLITPQTVYIPGMKFTISQIFPTGKYEKLSTNGLGLNATGQGAFQTTFGFATAKILWWTYPHPLHVRFFISYKVPATVHVEGFNAYGGGFGTDGIVCQGNTLTTDLGIELSLTQRWVFALDVVYVSQSKTRFHGISGTLADGSMAIVGVGYNDNLSLAPAIEYNWNENLGILWGIQFSVYGRSSDVITQGQFSVTYTW